MLLPPISKVIAVQPMSMVYDPYPPSGPYDTTVIQKLVRDILLSTHITILQTISLPNHLHRITTLKLSDNVPLILKLPPSSSTTLLRHERHCLANEAAVFTLLSKGNLPVPQILKYDPHSYLLGSPFLLTTHLPGIHYSEAYPYLSHAERQDVEQQIQTLTSHISKSISPTFGSAATVVAGSGLSTWREAFVSMMDSVLMDGEDMTVNLPYIEIREALSVWGDLLDEVLEARLVVVGLGRRENVMIEKGTDDVVGLMDFGRALWGDVAFAVEDDDDNDGGLEAFYSGKDIRRLLYTVYHACVTIVTNHYRPRDDLASGELDARKRLTTALGRLATMPKGKKIKAEEP